MNFTKTGVKSTKVDNEKCPSTGQKYINHNTAFYRQMKNTHDDAKKFRNYSKYFSLPHFLLPRNNR